MADDSWVSARKKIEQFNESLRTAPQERRCEIALAEVARQLINLNANLDVLSDVNEKGLDRIADNG